MTPKYSLLIITPFFAPQSHAAVFRAYKLAKFLPRRGWDVHVLTVDCNYNYTEDAELLTALGPNVHIHTAKYVEPTLRGLRMALGGRDRTFQSLKANSASATPTTATSAMSATTAASAVGGSPLRTLYKYLHRKINTPDVYWTWKGPALRKAGELIQKYGIGTVLTSSLPYTTMEIGYALKKRFGVRWVADFRDPMTYDSRCHSSDPCTFLRQQKIERAAVENADAVTTLTSAHPLILADTYGPHQTAKAHFIPTGLDPELLPPAASAPKNGEPYLIFIGEFLSQYGDEFFRILQRVLTGPQARALRLKVVGRAEINRARILPLVTPLKIADKVDFIDHLPQAKVYELVRDAQAAVICTSRVYPWWTSFAKLVDYIALNKPVVAIVPDPSETRKWLHLTGLGVFLDGSLDESAGQLRDFLARESFTPPAAGEIHRQKFFVTHQVAEFEKILLAVNGK